MRKFAEIIFVVMAFFERVHASVDCGSLVSHLEEQSCLHMAEIGIVGQGINSLGPNGRAWIGSDGQFTFRFMNQAENITSTYITVVLWLFESSEDYQAMCLNVRRPYITASLPRTGDQITISLAQDQVGAFAALKSNVTLLNEFGQISNTWGEFNTRHPGATFDISREVNMNGNRMWIKSSEGCTASFEHCTFECINGQDICYEAGTYELKNCGGNNPNAHAENGGMDGGCAFGITGGGYLDIKLQD